MIQSYCREPVTYISLAANTEASMQVLRWYVLAHQLAKRCSFECSCLNGSAEARNLYTIGQYLKFWPIS
jgi:hypothetical protein